MFRYIMIAVLLFGLSVGVVTLVIGVIFLHASETMRRLYEDAGE